MIRLSENTIKVLERRYLLKDEEGKVIETAEQMFRRVASSIAKAEPKEIEEIEEAFYRAMTDLEFLPNSPTLMNAGTRIGQLSACFVLPVEDSMDSIFKALRHMAIIHQTGGGTGFSFSRLRPNGDIVGSTKGIASGPVSFMKVFDTATEIIKQGGRRRGANMGILRVDHPDILEFIHAKEDGKSFSNFNLSVAVTDEFMEAVLKDKSYPLISPRTKKVVHTLKAKVVFERICVAAHKTGDPGLVFIDQINRHNPTPLLRDIESTNPCGELPLLPYESCNLGSINLSKFVEDGKLDWERLRRIVQLGVRFLDDVIEVNKFPIKQIRDITMANRKIGLGVMGFSDMLIKLGVVYNSEETIELARKLMSFIDKEAHLYSERLAKERGEFPNFKGSIYDKKKRLRNATLTTVAPTGTISIIAGCSSGIEPIFAFSFIRNVMEGTRLLEINPIFKEVAEREGFYSEGLMERIASQGSVQKIKEIPQKFRRLFVTTFDIEPEWHLKVQSAFQKYTDNSVSKTINLPSSATAEDVKKIYLEAYKLKCKGITIYRYGSKTAQVLSIGRVIESGPEYSGGCPLPYCAF